jgi:hypothetical protein
MPDESIGAPRADRSARGEGTPVGVWFAAVAVAGGLLLLAFLLLYLAGVLPVEPTAGGIKTLVAALALVGTFLAAAVSLIGIVLKDAIDRRSAFLAEAAEQRNRIETSLRAVGLLGTSNGQDAPVHQASGAVLALVNLGEYDLAVALATQLWPAGRASRQAVVQVVREAFRNGTTDTQYAVAALLLFNAPLLTEGRAFLWPFTDLVWPTAAAPRCRIALALAAVESFIADLGKAPETNPSATAVLYAALQDAETSVKGVAAAALGPMIRRRSDDDTFNFGATIVRMSDIKTAVSGTAQAAFLETTSIASRVETALAPKG